MDQAAEAAPPPVNPPASYPLPAQGSAAAPAGQAAKTADSGGRSKLPWIIGGLCALAAVVAVVLVLVFVVFGGGSGPEVVVQRFLDAVEDKDAAKVVEAMDPDFVADQEDALDQDYVDVIDRLFLAELPDGLDYDITKTKTETAGDTAEVNLVDGTLTYINAGGEEVVGDISEAGEDVNIFVLVKKGETWYMARETLERLDLDFSDLDAEELMLQGDGLIAEAEEEQASTVEYVNQVATQITTGGTSVFPEGMSVEDIMMEVQMRIDRNYSDYSANIEQARENYYKLAAIGNDDYREYAEKMLETNEVMREHLEAFQDLMYEFTAALNYIFNGEPFDLMPLLTESDEFKLASELQEQVDELLDEAEELKLERGL
jgi:hypothetical protein